MNGWQSELLTLLGISPTPENISWITQWAAAEEGQGAGFGPNTYSYYLNNPFNIKINGAFANFPSPEAGIAATAQWLQGNGNFGSLGTYADEIRAFLDGAPNNIAQSLAYFSGHQGDASQLTTSYQSLIGKGGSFGPNPGGSGSFGGATGSTPQGQNGGLFQGLFAPIEAGIASSGILVGAALLIVAGALWIALSNKDTQTVISDTVKKGTEAAALA